MRIRQLYSHFQSFKSLLEADYKSIVQVEYISHISAKKIINTIRKQYDDFLEKTEGLLTRLNKMGARCITFWDEDYPEVLRNIYDPPLIIYIRGSLVPSDQCSIAVVGTRIPTNYGKIQAERFTEVLSQQKITIISGMARGIDSIAHRTALKNDSRTIAVIGSGLDVIYPPENKALFYEIAEKCAVITEYEPGTNPDGINFPRRNRIISGLSIGVLIVESGFSGGAMNTASFAFDQNKEVFAVPGNVESVKSEGTNLLIRKDIAKLVTSGEDILTDLELTLRPYSKSIKSHEHQVHLNHFEEKLVKSLDSEPKQIDSISAASGISTAECLVHLLALELKGVVRQYPGKMFSLLI